MCISRRHVFSSIRVDADILMNKTIKQCYLLTLVCMFMGCATISYGPTFLVIT